MASNLTHLLSAYNLNGLPLKNRVVMAPLTRSRAGAEQLPNELMAEYYTQRASAGLIVSEGTSISEQAIGWLHVPGIYTEQQAEAWQQVTAALHDKGTPIFLQLWHCGRASHSSFHGGKLAVAPSAIAINGDPIHTPTGKQPYETPRALETEEIARVVAEYRHAARLAKQAGFDGVEIHSANGYLLDTFLQSKTNHRSDRYGGSIENRIRFPIEAVEAVAKVWGPGRVGIRLSPGMGANGCGESDALELYDALVGELDRIEIALRASDATLCLTTALSHHDLTDVIPSEIDVALPRSRRPPRVR
ncbi:alkene reductase [bacterium]|nr:alkene reductase [bacterium]